MLTIRNYNFLPRKLKSVVAVLGVTFGAVTACNGLDGPTETRLTLQVAAARVNCTGSFEQQCYRVRTLPDTAWTLFYDHIAGFEYEAGFTYVISVVSTPVLNPMADASDRTYRLLKILQKDPG
ncbi:MAG: DUF4377 domain-containing protein [Gemmatimonadaceae bacterium]